MIAFLWAVCSGVGRAVLMFQEHISLSVFERAKETIVTSGPSPHLAPVEAPVFKIHSVSSPSGEARRIIIGNILKP